MEGDQSTSSFCVIRYPLDLVMVFTNDQYDNGLLHKKSL